MFKIPTVFIREYENTYQVVNEPNPECQWVLDGEGTPYRKWQGMAAMIRDGIYYKRFIIKKDKEVDPAFILCTTDPKAGKQFGWLPVDFKSSQDKHYTKAFNSHLPDGTYELIGPKIHGNLEGMHYPVLMNHKGMRLVSIERSFTAIKKLITNLPYEGLVFHHPDGRMAKIKRKDFGLTR